MLLPPPPHRLPKNKTKNRKRQVAYNFLQARKRGGKG
jgi:hypothetical protein